ncbi:MAG: pyrroline-5-carboxylate reductase, partial [Pseudomonadota bacterium]
EEFARCIDEIDVLVLAVKPQILESLCSQISNQVSDSLPILSIAAGYSLNSFHKAFPETQPIIRCMPNTPGAIGKGITGILKTDTLTPDHQSMANTLLSALGEVVWVDDENLMDSITAVSGSGPAYVFYLIEALTKAAIDSGLTEDTATTLARQTVIGAAALADNQTDVPASTLRENVTSPGGTTEAALNILMDGQFQDALTQAVKAATQRGKELSE